MRKIKALIVEDEDPAIEELKYILSKYDFIDNLSIAKDSITAYDLAKKINPDVIFMDVNVPIENGISVGKKIKKFNKEINIIYITAYEQHAVSAFEIDALDYILKPFDESRIDITIDRLIHRIEKKSTEKVPIVLDEILNKLEEGKNVLKKIPCERNGKIILVKTKDIYYCYTSEDKTYVKLKDKQYITNNTLKEIESKTNFFRVHRSYIVNIDNIKELYSWFNGTYKVVMDDEENSEVPVSRSNVRKIKEVLGI
ncbi:response regulator transcription factor [Clostridium niameyense]|uniref:Stage 0 sporulation protein A homolog n=1 Tax=Clostridium niameyense TaxID=1622073 RepID=A0A6M0R965_9CLOT|nr:LytTR family DNA-binding domain-containing protein [Clostridium niameyense]NEZ46792.1 response regulator transcription factor [Clostridium niameyense]